MNFRHLLGRHSQARRTFEEVNEHDFNQAEHLLNSNEGYVFADAGYRGVATHEVLKDTAVDWHISERPGKSGFV